MSSRSSSRTRSPRRRQTKGAWRPSRDWLEGHLWANIASVRAFVARRHPALARAVADWCERVKKDAPPPRQRAFMHTGHRKDVICVAPGAERLPVGHQVGLALHEFGHIATGKGDVSADLWVFREFGIAILYRGPRKLEWVSPATIRGAGI